jgi:two-component system, sensor histidine kinase and response regulator
MTKILVIEDETILRGEVVEWLNLEGYEVAGAGNGVEGVERAFQNIPDLIICDITMPLLNGYGVLLEVRANPTTASVPFIFVTARAAYEDIRKGMILGADDYITKPFSRRGFLQAVQTRLQKKEAQELDRLRAVDELQKALAQEQERLMVKAKMVAMFSHDFRNPLASIISSAGLLRDYSDRMDEQRRLAHLNRVEASARQLVQMLDDMLVVAQMETGHLDFKPEPVNVTAFFQSMVEDFQTIYSETYQILFEGHFAGPLIADPRLLQQIGANLISNAIKYSPQGSEVRISLENYEEQCVLTVQDQGIGIPEDDQARLFEAFQRGSNVGPIQGTGLGLAIVKHAVDLHGGTILLESQIGSGTKITVTIPTSQPLH